MRPESGRSRSPLARDHPHPLNEATGEHAWVVESDDHPNFRSTDIRVDEQLLCELAAGFVKDILESLDNPDTPSVICMMAGSLTHEVLDEAELREYIEGRISTLQNTMIARMNADKRDGLLAADFEPQLVVPVVSTYMQGLWRMALVSYDRSRFEQQIEVFLTGLGL